MSFFVVCLVHLDPEMETYCICLLFFFRNVLRQTFSHSETFLILILKLTLSSSCVWLFSRSLAQSAGSGPGFVRNVHRSAPPGIMRLSVPACFCCRCSQRGKVLLGRFYLCQTCCSAFRPNDPSVITAEG